MIELIQIPWSPFCLAQARILAFSGVAHKTTNIPPSDRSRVWRLTRQRYYQVPVLKDGRNVLFELDDDSQVIAKYLDSKLRLGLFPPHWDGIQRVIWRHIENEIEGMTFKLNDAYYREFVPPSEQLDYLRFKERKFGRGCLDHWFQQQKQLFAELTGRLMPFEQMVGHRDFLLEAQPRFVDFDLWGMLANLLYSGHYKLPAAHPRLKQWYGRMSNITNSWREKLHS
jgi:glutathione S-transferase